MKKTIGSLLAIALIMTCTQATAQTGTTFGVRAGIDFQNITGKYDNGNKMSNKLIPGFNAGVNVEIPIAPDFYIQPNVLLAARGAKYENTGSYTSTVHLLYLEVPVNLVYKPALGAGHLIAGFGPYVDFGLGGQIKYEGTNSPSNRDVVFKNSISVSDNTDNAYYRRVGAGADLLFGYEFANRLSFQLNTQLGLTDINPKGYGNDAKAKHVGFGISAGYRF